MILNNRAFWPCCFFITICLLISALSGYVTSHGMGQWYLSLKQPPFNPPSWVFAPVWTVLYCLIGIAGGLLWCEREQLTTLWRLYMLQLGFNFAWSFIFFGAHQIGLAMMDLLALWGTLLVLQVLAWREARRIFYCLTPYFLWSSFAFVLNVSLFILN